MVGMMIRVGVMAAAAGARHGVTVACGRRSPVQAPVDLGGFVDGRDDAGRITATLWRPQAEPPGVAVRGSQPSVSLLRAFFGRRRSAAAMRRASASESFGARGHRAELRGAGAEERPARRRRTTITASGARAARIENLAHVGSPFAGILGVR